METGHRYQIQSFIISGKRMHNEREQSKDEFKMTVRNEELRVRPPIIQQFL